MDGYPDGSLDHNVPYIVASGLNGNAINDLPLAPELKEQAILIKSDLPPLESREADVLEKYFEEINEKGKAWKGVTREEGYRFRVKTAGRSLLLPPRRAKLETDEPLEAGATLHSPFSPLSPSSALYHDGLINAQWIKKHQHLVPAIFISFYNLTSDPSSVSQEDARLKADLNSIRTALQRSGYKTRLAIVMLGNSDHGPMPISEAISERLENIRRGAALDPKSIFYIPPQESPQELRGVVDNVFGVLYQTSIEYYRDLGRHARKKRARGVAPPPSVPPTSSSRNLTLPDWNFRYDFKAGVFAEFRQEADAALRFFEQAYEVLLGQDVLDIIPSWSPRWNEARMLADIIAIRCLRLHFWLGHTSIAVRRWTIHKERIGDFVERRGSGVNTYGWAAWEARWASVMAGLIEALEVPGLVPATERLHLPPEKGLAGERVQAWEMLHHTGYWHRTAARHLNMRRALARNIADEDRIEPDDDAAKQHSFSYDNYLCPEPWEEYPLDGEGVNHSQLIIASLALAREQFEARDQLRFCAEISLETAKELTYQEKWMDALVTLQPLWEAHAFRGEQWVDVAEDLCWLMRRAAAESGRADLVIAADWELMNKRFTRRPKWHYDIARSLEGVTVDAKPLVSLTEETVKSFLSASFVFRTKESKAGQTCTGQLSLTSTAFSDASPLVLTSLKIESEGALRPILVEQEDSDERTDGKLVIIPTKLTEEFSSGDGDLPSLLRGSSDLTLHPGQTRVFELEIPLRESGDAEVNSLVLSYHGDAFDLDYTMSLSGANTAGGWRVAGQSRPKHSRPGAHMLHVQPKPPKMEIKLLDLADDVAKQFYANERIELAVELLNAEDETANVKLDVQITGKEIPSFTITSDGATFTAAATDSGFQLPSLPVPSIVSSQTHGLVLSVDPATVPTAYELQIRASYHLESDPATPITQLLTQTLTIVNAFEANYDLLPRLHSEAWPSLFDPENVQAPEEDSDVATLPPKGLAQKWCLKCHYASFATEDLIVLGLEAKILSVVGGGKCEVVRGVEVPDEGIVTGYKTMHEAAFDLVARKGGLDDRSPVSLELGFTLRWRRESDVASVENESTLPVGKYLVLGSEPRVLATLARPAIPTSSSSSTDSALPGLPLTTLILTIENPSSHFLTFGLTMEPSDEFAFSGAKSTSLNLLPLARRQIEYRLLPLVRGKWVRPGLVVRDRYFQKVLRVIPGEGMKIDKEGLLIWVPGEAGEDDEDGDDGQDDE